MIAAAPTGMGPLGELHPPPPDSVARVGSGSAVAVIGLAGSVGVEVYAGGAPACVGAGADVGLGAGVSVRTVVGVVIGAGIGVGSGADVGTRADVGTGVGTSVLHSRAPR